MSRVLKMYHLNANDYGEEWYTTAYSKEEAIVFILDWLKNPDNHKYDSDKKYAMKHYEYLKNIDVNNPSSFPDKYTLDEYSQGEVIQSEVA